MITLFNGARYIPAFKQSQATMILSGWSNGGGELYYLDMQVAITVHHCVGCAISKTNYSK